MSISVAEGSVYFTEFATSDIANQLLRPQNILYVIPESAETDLKIESAEFHHKSANKFSEKKFHSIKLKTFY